MPSSPSQSKLLSPRHSLQPEARLDRLDVADMRECATEGILAAGPYGRLFQRLTARGAGQEGLHRSQMRHRIGPGGSVRKKQTEALSI